MKKMKRLLSFLLAVLLVFSSCNITQAAAGSEVNANTELLKSEQIVVAEETTVSIRVEYADATMFEETEVTIQAGASFAGYGFEGLTETNYATPLHAIAQLLVDNGADTEDMLEYVQATEGGWGAYMSTIDKDGSDVEYDKSSGICNYGEGLDATAYSWMYAVNDVIGSNSCGVYKLEQDSQITFFASYYSASTTSYYANFNQTNYSIEDKESIHLQLLGEDSARYPTEGIAEPIADAEIVIYDEYGNSIKDLYECFYEMDYSEFYQTDELGKVCINIEPIYKVLEDIYAQGEYDLTVSAIKKETGNMVISRAKAYITINEPYESVWASYRNNNSNNGVMDSKTPTNIEETAQNWTLKLKESSEWSKSLSEAIITDKYIFIVVSNTLHKLHYDGNIVESMTLTDAVDSVSRMVYVDGIAYIPLTTGIVQAVNVVTMTSLWQTSAVKDVQSLTPLTYKDGYLYGTYSKTTGNGTLYKIDVTDEDPFTENEEKEHEWKKSIDDAYYWSGQLVIGDVIIIGNDSGTVSTYSTEGVLIDSIITETKSKIRCTMVEYKGYVYFSDYTGNFYRVLLNVDGTIEGISSVKIGIKSVSTPTIYNGRAYVGAYDGDTKTGKITVVDVEKMEVIYSAIAPKEVQSAPLVSTAYATQENNQMVYVYFTSNVKPGGIYMISDNSIATSAETKLIYTPEEEKQNYCMATINCDEKGNLYYVNDSGNLFSIGKKQQEEPKPKPEPQIYAINYVLNNGINNKDNPVSYTQGIAVDLRNPTRHGYTFVGWYSDATLKNKVTSIVGESTGNKTLYAKWIANKYQVTFNARGGKIKTKSKTVTYGTTYGTLPKVTRRGYTFIGWYTKKSGGSKIVSRTNMLKVGNHTLHACWKKVTVKRATVSKVSKTKKRAIKVSFKKLSGVKGYKLSYSTNKKFTKKTAKSKISTKRTYTTPKLKKGKRYYVRVRAYKLDSTGKKVYGKWSKVRTIRF